MLIYDLAYFYIRICVGLWSVCCRFVIGLSSGLSACCRLRFQHCANGRFSFSVKLVIYRSQIGRFHTESYPKWPRHEPDWFYGVFSNIVGGRQLADSLKILRFLSVLCRFGRCDWGITQIHALFKQYGESYCSLMCHKRRLSARLQYLQCVSNGDTAVLHWAINMYFSSNILFDKMITKTLNRWYENLWIQNVSVEYKWVNHKQSFISCV